MKVSGSSETVLRSRICYTIVAQEVEETLSVHRFLNQPKPSSDSESAVQYLCKRLKKLWLYEFFWIHRNHYQIHCKHNHTMKKENVDFSTNVVCPVSSRLHLQFSLSFKPGTTLRNRVATSLQLSAFFSYAICCRIEWRLWTLKLLSVWKVPGKITLQHAFWLI